MIGTMLAKFVGGPWAGKRCELPRYTREFIVPVLTDFKPTLLTEEVQLPPPHHVAVYQLAERTPDIATFVFSHEETR
jgi:hypothetical protein